MLNRASILVVEDEPWIALDVAMAIEDAGGEVVGPFASVREALALLASRPVDAAILDVNLTDRDVTPVVEHLIRLGVPLIIQTGVGLPARLEARFPALVTHTKPCVAAELVSRLVELISQQGASSQNADPSPRSG